MSKSTRIAGAATAVVLGAASAAHAKQISLNLYVYSNNFDEVTNATGASTAGAAAQSNFWNNLQVGPNSVGTFSNPTTTFTDSNGSTVSGLSLSYGTSAGGASFFTGGGNGSYAFPNFGNKANDAGFVNDYVGSTQGNSANDAGDEITISGIPAAYAAAGYSVYAYFSSNQASAATYYAQDLSSGGSADTFYNTGNISAQTGYSLVTSTVSTSPTAGDYAVFPESGITSVTYAFSFVGTNVNSIHVYGFQIVEAPEPASMGLLAAASAAALLRRRRSRA